MRLRFYPPSEKPPFISKATWRRWQRGGAMSPQSFKRLLRENSDYLKQVISAMEAVHGQRKVAEMMGVSDRLLRYYKEGKRRPSRQGAEKIYRALKDLVEGYQVRQTFRRWEMVSLPSELGEIVKISDRVQAAAEGGQFSHVFVLPIDAMDELAREYNSAISDLIFWRRRS